MAKRMLADVLREAADVHLATNRFARGEEFSCHAMYRALHGPRWRKRRGFNTVAQTFLWSLGCDLGADGFGGLVDDEQGTRYMWLHLAAHVAEDEGIEVTA